MAFTTIYKEVTLDKVLTGHISSKLRDPEYGFLRTFQNSDLRTAWLRPMFKVYRTSTTSCTYFVYVIFRVLTYLLPLIIVFASQGIWKKWGTYREMPNLLYNGEYIVIGEGANNSHFYSSSISPLNQADSQHFVLSEEEHQWEQEERYSKITVDLTLFLRNSTVEHLTFMLFFHLSLDRNSIVKAHIPLIETLHLDGRFNSVKMRGRLQTDQTRPFSSTTNIDVLDTNVGNIDYYKPNEIIDRAIEADLALKYNRVVTTFHTGAANSLSLSLSFIISEEEFQYQTGLLELLKWAWIQYLAVYLVILSIINSAFETLFANHLLSHVPIKQN